MDYLQTLLAKLKEFEGCIPWMYLDGLGNVTCGIGLMLPTAERACQLPFHPPADPQVALAEEIAAEFARVKALLPNRLPRFYKTITSLELAPEVMDEFCLSHLKQDEASLRGGFAAWEQFPDAAKIGLLDMVYNLGPGRFFAQYTRLQASVLAQRWDVVATECHRRGISDARNVWTVGMFSAAAATTTNGG